LARALGDDDAAEVHLRAALALAPDDVYSLVALADLLLDTDRPVEVIGLLTARAEPDPSRLRLAIATRRANDPAAADHAAVVRANLDAGAARGDTGHLRERARYFLDVEPDAAQALAAARANWDLQREAADARVLLDAATAANHPASAAPVLAWMNEREVDDAILRRARARMEGQR
jgi:hypothetical protein